MMHEVSAVNVACDGVSVRMLCSPITSLGPIRPASVCPVPSGTVALTTPVWAQAAIPIQAMSDWLNTIAWYGLVPALRIGGVMLLIFGFANLGGSVRGSTGFGLAMMIAGGLALLAPEIANAIYSRTTVGTDWATNPTS